MAAENPENPETPAIDRVRAVRNRIKALAKHEERKLDKQRADALEAGQFARYTQIADSLMADPASAPRGTAKGAVVNIHTQAIDEIALNPALDAVENAELLYRKARRGRRGYETVTALIAGTEAKLGRLKDIIVYIDEITGGKQPDELDDDDAGRVMEAAAEFLPPEEGKRGGKKAGPPPPPFRKYVIDGWEIYLGKSSAQNDELSTRFAKPSDIWLHVAAHAGSHVIIRHKKDTPNPPKTVIEKAAQLAVWHSKARHTSYAEVHVTEARFVRKRRHAPPGEVIAERCKTVRVEPKDPKLILT
jgi:predicted ribosome quality control (RQC) complex YloA/Tae2 family protein